MSPEERQLLIQTHRLVEENNKLLRKMHRSAIWGSIFRFIYWVAIIGASVGAYYLIQPYVDQLKGVYGGIQQDVSTVRNTVNQVSGAASQLGDLGKLIKGFKQ